MLTDRMMRILLFLSLYFLSDISPAHAYIDPNTGGYVFQLLFPLFAGIAAGYVFFKKQIKRLLSMLLSFFKKSGGSQ
jgi:hypothetical protein